MDLIISCSIKHLKSKFYHFPDGWVEACIEWLFQEHKDNIYEMSNGKWCDLIEQQWLFTDLRDFNTPSMLNNISPNLMKFDGVACFQIMRFKNVAKSYYSQVREIKGTVNENSLVSAETTLNATITSNRTLMLTLTDGVSEIDAFEFEPWLDIEMQKMSIGCKCCLKGPFIIRRKIAFLKQANIGLLGGEVEEISGVSHLSVIEEQLHLNVSKSKSLPKIKEKKPMISISTTNTNLLIDKAIKSPEINVKPTVIKSEKIDCRTTGKNSNNNNSRQNQKKISNPNPSTSNDVDFDTFSEDDQILMSLSMEELLAEANVSQTQTRNIVETVTNQEESQPNIDVELEDDSFNEIIDDDESFAKIIEGNESLDRIINCEPIARMAKNDEPCNSPLNKGESQNPIVNNECLAGAINDEEHIASTIKHEESLTKTITDDLPVIRVIDIFYELSKPEASDIEIKQFKIKGMIMKFNTKLAICNDEPANPRWNLEVLVGDGTGTVNCLLDDKFISERIGLTARQFDEMKHSKLIDKCRQCVGEFQESIRQCNCGIFTLLLCDKYNKLCIVDHQALDMDSIIELRNTISEITHGS